MSISNLVIHDNQLRFRFQNSEHSSRISGQWFDNKVLSELDIANQKKYESVFTLLRTLPGWPLVDGINMRKKPTVDLFQTTTSFYQWICWQVVGCHCLGLTVVWGFQEQEC